MKKHILIIAGIILFSFSSCQAEAEKQKKQMIEERISEIKTEMTAPQKKENLTDQSDKKAEKKSPGFVEKLKEKLPHKSKGDSIIGVWEVKKNNYQAIYEIVKHDNQYFGKVHYYNDGTTEVKAQNNQNDYFLDGLFFNNGKYSAASMYMPDGNKLKVVFKLEGDELTAEMTLEDHPYKEVWKRKEIQAIKAATHESK